MLLRARILPIELVLFLCKGGLGVEKARVLLLVLLSVQAGERVEDPGLVLLDVRLQSI